MPRSPAKVRRVDFSPDEWLSGTIGLSNAERGLYITACAMIYSRGKPVPIWDIYSACTDHGNALKSQLSVLVSKGKLLRNGDEIDQKRARNELQKAAKRSRNGRENVSKRWKNKGLDPPVVLQGGKANHQPSTINHQLVKKEQINRPVSASGPNVDPSEIMTQIWNEECGSIARANRPNASRKATCAKRWRDGFSRDAELWRAYCQRIAAAPHLRGENDRGWRADLDWVLEPRNITHIDEGRYDPRLANGRGNGSAGPDEPPPRPEELWGDDDGRKVGLAC